MSGLEDVTSISQALTKHHLLKGTSSMGILSSKRKNLTDQVFGYLTVLYPIGCIEGRIGYFWRCRCICGTEKDIRTFHLGTKNGIKSCGCKLKEFISQKNGRHHMTGKKEYKSWQGMKSRCLDPTNKDYSRYGGRNIAVCKRWLDSFDNFLEDMQLSPGPGYTLDRIDNTGNYEPSNCRWTTKTTQARNRRSNKILTFNGKSHTVAEWSEIIGINRYALYGRIKLGWDTEEILSTPSNNVRTKNRGLTLTIDGVEKTKVEWAQHFGVRYDTLIARLNKGWPVEKAVIPCP